MDKPIDKLIAISALTSLERRAAELRTKIAGIKQLSVDKFNDLERVIIGDALSVEAVTKVAKFDFTASSVLAYESNKWWKHNAKT